MSYRAGPAGHYRTEPRFDDAVPLERQLAHRHPHRDVSAAYLATDGLGSSCSGLEQETGPDPQIGSRRVLDAIRAEDAHAGIGMGVVEGEWDWLYGPGGGPLGDVNAWNYPSMHYMTASGVYVVRLKCTGLPLTDGAALLLFVKALGLNQTLGFDIRGAGAWQDPGAPADSWWVDLIATVSGFGIPSPTSPDNIASIATNIQADPALRQSFPALAIDAHASYWGELTAPPQAIDFWRSQPVLWDHNLPGPKCIATFGGCGGPTNTFAAPPASSIVKGKADDGTMATPFPISGQVPIVSPDATSKGYSFGAIHVLGLMAIAGALGFGYYHYYGKKGRSR